MTHLYLSENYLLHFRILPNYGLSIEHMDLDYNRISKLRNLLPNFRSLSMNHIKIVKFCEEEWDFHCTDLRDMTQLNELFLRSNLIVALDGGTFVGTGNLTILDLDYTLISYVPDSRFDWPIALEVHQLSDNQLTELPEICGLENLVELRLDDNKILSAHDVFFCSLPKLEVINLSRNGLQSVAANTFHSLLSFEELDLSWKNIKSLPYHWSGFKSNLRTLRLDGNFFEYFANMSLGLSKELQLLSIGSLKLACDTTGRNANQ